MRAQARGERRVLERGQRLEAADRRGRRRRSRRSRRRRSGGARRPARVRGRARGASRGVAARAGAAPPPAAPGESSVVELDQPGDRPARRRARAASWRSSQSGVGPRVGIGAGDQPVARPSSSSALGASVHPGAPGRPGARRRRPQHARAARSSRAATSHGDAPRCASRAGVEDEDRLETQARGTVCRASASRHAARSAPPRRARGSRRPRRQLHGAPSRDQLLGRARSPSSASWVSTPTSRPSRAVPGGEAAVGVPLEARPRRSRRPTRRT